MSCRGRSRGLSIEVLRRAMQDGTLEAALQRDTPVPSDRKRCKLCGEIKALENFRELPRGGHESYCRPCNKYVRRGIKRGLHIEAVRQAFMVRCGTDGLTQSFLYLSYTCAVVHACTSRAHLCTQDTLYSTSCSCKDSAGFSEFCAAVTVLLQVVGVYRRER